MKGVNDMSRANWSSEVTKTKEGFDKINECIDKLDDEQLREFRKFFGCDSMGFDGAESINEEDE